MKIAIFSKDKKQQDKIYASVSCYCKNNSYDAELCLFTCSHDLLCSMQTRPPNILYFNIQSQLDVSIAEQARHYSPHCAMIFISPHREFAIDAYRLDGISYLLSPIKENEICKALQKCHSILESSRFITVRLSRHMTVNLALSRIYYIEVLNKRIIFHTEQTAISALNLTLNKVESMVGSYPFYRCHRCYIVNLNYVSSLAKGQFILKNNETVMIRKNGFPQARLCLSNFISQQFLENNSILFDDFSNL